MDAACGLLHPSAHRLRPRRHHTDGGGDSDHVFALCGLLGFRFAPRIPDLKHRRLYSFAKPSAYPSLEPMIAGRINVALIRAHGSQILRIIASIRAGTVTASLIMRQLAASRARTALPRRCARSGGWSVLCSRSTGSVILTCGARPATNSTRARRATAWHAQSLSTGWAK
jgi:TnpA family transposase